MRDREVAYVDAGGRRRSPIQGVSIVALLRQSAWLIPEIRQIFDGREPHRYKCEADIN